MHASLNRSNLYSFIGIVLAATQFVSNVGFFILDGKRKEILVDLGGNPSYLDNVRQLYIGNATVALIVLFLFVMVKVSVSNERSWGGRRHE
jgi:hypothetical protein